MEQFFQIFVICLQAANHDVVHMGQFEESVGRPVRGDLYAILASSIVVKDLHAFKAQLLQKAIRFALNVQPVAIMTTATKILNGTLAQDAPLMQDDHGITDLVDVAEQM